MKQLALFCILFVFVACTQVQKGKQAAITVSILPHKYLVERIVGNRFEVNVLTPPGANHETYEPTPRQIKSLDETTLLMINGYLLFEDHIALKSGRSSNMILVDLSRDVDLIVGEAIEHGDHVHLHGVDPHFWLSPTEVKTQVQHIYAAACLADPEGVSLFEKNYHDLLNDIDSLDQFIRQTFNNLRTRTFLIYHPALSYFARDYNLHQVAIEMEGKDPTVQQMKTIVDLARSENIKTVFIQQQFNLSTASAVATEIGGKVVTLNPVPENWLESMYAMTQALHQAMTE